MHAGVCGWVGARRGTHGRGMHASGPVRSAALSGGLLPAARSQRVVRLLGRTLRALRAAQVIALKSAWPAANVHHILVKRPKLLLQKREWLEAESARVGGCL